EEPAHPGRERGVELEARADFRPALPGHIQAGALEVRGGDAPRLADRRLAARQRHGIEPREPLERREAAAQQLAAPERPVRAVAGAVEDERQRGPLLAVL